MRMRNGNLVVILAALVLPQSAFCGTLTGILEGLYKGEKVPIERAYLEPYDPDNANTTSLLPLTLDANGSFLTDLPDGEYRFRIYAHAIDWNYKGFYDGKASPYGVCFLDGELVTVTAGSATDISSVLELRPIALLVSFPFAISGEIMGSTGDPQECEIIALDACSGVELARVKITSKEFLLRGEWTSQLVRLRFVSNNYLPEFYGADGQDDFSLAMPLPYGTETVNLGTVVLGSKVPEISVDPTVLGFGSVVLLESETQAITVANEGTRQLEVNAVAFETPHSDISLTDPPTTPFTLDPGESRTISITYSPHAMGDAAAVLAVTSTDQDESKVMVSLTGSGVASEAPANEQVSQAVDFIETATTAGTLTPTGPGERDTMLMNQIISAGEMAAAGKSAAACAQLQNALQRVDGDPIPPDFLEGPDRELLEQLLQNTIDSLGCR